MNKKNVVFSGVVLVVLVIFGGFLFKEKFMGKVTDKMVSNQNVSEKSEEIKEEGEAPIAETWREADGQKNGPESMELGETTVELTDKGFVPDELTVKKGTAVRFVNRTTAKMSVASDPHPTHTDYPEFDQWKSGFKGKSEYTFTFYKAGSWGFHDHFNPSMKGTVVVSQ